MKRKKFLAIFLDQQLFLNNGIPCQFRTGQNVRLKIQEPGSPARVNENVIPGSSTVLDLDKDYSKVFLGGVPAEFQIQPAVHHQSFDGKIDEFSLGGAPVGLWNFVESSNVDGISLPE